jgi:hypothetical protein
MNQSFRKMRPVTFRILRYLTHASLAMACAMNFNGNSASKACRLLRKQDHAEMAGMPMLTFFVEQMTQDFKIIQKLTNDCSAEEAAMRLHMAIRDMKPTPNQNCSHSSIRAAYETEFQSMCVAPLYDNDVQTKKRMADIAAGSKSGAEQLALGARLDEAISPDPMSYPRLLRFREPLTYASFRFKFTTDPEACARFPVLNAFVTSTDKLRIASHLYTFLRFQSLVYRRYAKKLSRKDAEQMTIMEAIEAIPEERDEWIEAFKAYHQSWNELAIEHTEFECQRVGGEPGHNWPGMCYLKAVVKEEPQLAPDGPISAAAKADWESAARHRFCRIKFGVIDVRDSHGNGGYDPDSCMAKLHVDKCLNFHNEFIHVARDFVADGAQHESPELPVHLVREKDMIPAKDMMDDFERATREHATQSLEYGQGTMLAYDYEGIQDWVLQHIVGNVPVIETNLAVFSFAGETYERKTVIGGVKQEELSADIAEAVTSRDLDSLQMLQRASARLEECMDLMDIITAQNGDESFGEYCQRALGFTEDDMADFGPASGACRTAVRLKHLQSLRDIIGDLLIDPVGTLDERYSTALTAELETALRAFASKVGAANLKIFMNVVKDFLIDNFQEFRQPYPGGTALAMFLDWSATPDGDCLNEFEWYNDNFPTDDLLLDHLKGVWNTLSICLSETKINVVSEEESSLQENIQFEDMGAKGKASFWEKIANR